MKKSVIYYYENRSLEDLPDECWKDIPGFDGCYQVSNLGRIKSVRRWRNSGNNTGYYTKEMIRKQFPRIKKNHLLNQDTHTVGITLKMNGKSCRSSTARYVYCAFVEPFDLDNKKNMVSYKDFDGRNLHYKNLILTNRSDISKRSIELKRAKPRFEQYRLPIRQLTIDGKLIATYSSITEAEKKTGISISGISNCLTGYIYQFKGFRWESPSKPPPPPAVMKKRTKQFFNDYLWDKLGKPPTSLKQPIAALNLHPENMKGERWKPIAGCDEGFLISNFGKAKGIARFKNGRLKGWTKGMVKRLIPDGKEHKPTSCLLEQLTENGRKFQRSVARLVYYHFIGEINLEDRKISIQYKNGKCYDLNYKNLLITT